MLYSAAAVIRRLRAVENEGLETLESTHRQRRPEGPAARKLIHLAFAIVKSGKAFDPHFATTNKADSEVSTEVVA